MKRSEMIKLITEVLESFKRIVEADDDAKAVALLTALEEAGMQPPQREVKGGHLVPAEDGQDAMLTYSIIVNEWEPEND